MTEKIRGAGFGKYVVSLIGVLAMAAVVTGAAVASNSPSGRAPLNADLASASASDTAAATPTVVVSESAEPTTPDLDNDRTPMPSAGATCDPNADKLEDAAEASAKAADPLFTEGPGMTEPPTCKTSDKDNDATTDKDGDRGQSGSGNGDEPGKTGGDKSGGSDHNGNAGGDGSGHSGH